MTRYRNREYRILSNICLNGLFYSTEMTQVCSFVDNTMFYSCDKDLNALTGRLERNTCSGSGIVREEFDETESG